MFCINKNSINEPSDYEPNSEYNESGNGMTDNDVSCYSVVSTWHTI